MRKRALYVLLMAFMSCIACRGNVFAVLEEPGVYILSNGPDLQYLSFDNENLLVFDDWYYDDDTFPDPLDANCTPQNLIISRLPSFRVAELWFYERSNSWATVVLPSRTGSDALSFVPTHTISDFQHIMDCGIEYNGYAMHNRPSFRNVNIFNNHDENDSSVCNGDGTVPDGDAQPVPEPASIAMLGTGLLGFIGYKFRKE